MFLIAMSSCEQLGTRFARRAFPGASKALLSLELDPGAR